MANFPLFFLSLSLSPFFLPPSLSLRLSSSVKGHEWPCAENADGVFRDMGEGGEGGGGGRPPRLWGC